MSHIMNLTDKQWYNFICGMQAGLKLKDMTLPMYDTNIVLKPIGVGGHGQIGIAIPQVIWDGVSLTGFIPVFTHDVDIGYSGFSCRITWDTSRLQVNGLVDGEFGVVGTDIIYSIDNGVLLARGLKDAPNEYNVPLILFYLDITILDTNITKSNPININLISGNGYDPNYTTLLKYVQNEIDGQHYLYYITPIRNISGAIVSEKESNIGTVGDDKTVAAPKSPSGIFIGVSYTQPGSRGVVPIVANSNVEDNFPYNGIQTKVVVEDNFSIFNYIEVVGMGDWNLQANTYINNDGYLQLDIKGNRSEARQDSVTVGYIFYEINNTDSSYVIPLKNIMAKLINI